MKLHAAAILKSTGNIYQEGRPERVTGVASKMSQNPLASLERGVDTSLERTDNTVVLDDGLECSGQIDANAWD